MGAFVLQKCHPSLAGLDYFFHCLYLRNAYSSNMVHLEQKVLHCVPQNLISSFLYFGFDVLSASSCCISVFTLRCFNYIQTKYLLPTSQLVPFAY